jgi:tetratricopeptide (TPR) repeat protein
MQHLSRYVWQIYENFVPDAHGLPHPGDLLCYYRLYREKTREEVAAALTCSTAVLEDVEQRRLLFDDVTKREAAASLLAIPPLLLGLEPYHAPLREAGELTPQQFNELLVLSGAPVVDPAIVQSYMGIFELLSISEDLPAASSQRALFYWIDHLEQYISKAREVARDQYRALVYEFLSRLGWLALQQGDLPRAYDATTGALEQGAHLANAELLLSALQQRIAIFLKQKQEALAVQDFEAALRQAEIFYQAINHPPDLDAYRAAEVSSCYTSIVDRLADQHLAERMRDLNDRTLAVVLEGQKANPTEIFTLLSQKPGRAQQP